MSARKRRGKRENRRLENKRYRQMARRAMRGAKIHGRAFAAWNGGPGKPNSLPLDGGQ